MKRWPQPRVSAFARLTLLSRGESLNAQTRYRYVFQLTLLLPLLLTGCSWISEILVVNKSKHTAAVTFTYGKYDCPNCEFVPTVYRVERWQNDSIPVFGDTVSVYWRTNADSTWYVELKSGQALVISEGLNADMRIDDHVRLLLTDQLKLRIVMPNDANIICSGDSCFPEIHKFSRARSGIIIR